MKGCFEHNEKTKEHILRLCHLIPCVSAERIQTELKKILCGKAVERILTDFIPVICTIIPELALSVGLDQKNQHHIYDVYTHTVKVVAATPPKVHLRLAALFHDIA